MPNRITKAENSGWSKAYTVMVYNAKDMVILGYIAMLAAALFMIMYGFRCIKKPEKVVENYLRKNEASWYYTKTWLGKKALRIQQRRFEYSRKEEIFKTRIGGIGAMFMGVVLLYCFWLAIHQMKSN